MKLRCGFEMCQMQVAIPRCLAVCAVLLAPAAFRCNGADTSSAVRLPEGVAAVWDLDRAHRESTSTRERISLNGLWRWQPADGAATDVPMARWGYFKVPGSWPGITDYMQKDSQRVCAHPDWEDVRLGSVRAAWYEREITVPEGWSGRRIVLHLDCLNSHALVLVDGRGAGEAHFPEGEVDLTAFCRPGGKHRLSLRVVALPLADVLESYTDSATSREAPGSVARRGLCGDATLMALPDGARITSVRVDPSVRKREVRLAVQLADLAAGRRYALQVRLAESQDGGEPSAHRSPSFTERDLDAEGRMMFAVSWMPGALWDLHTPGNKCFAEATLFDEGGQEIDVAWKETFGFREFWIEGKNFMLNGSRVFLPSVPLDNAQVGAAWVTYDAARESLERLRSTGIRFVFTHNYGCEPGAHLAFHEILRAADDVGMLVALSQPHFSHYDWDAPDADNKNGYARHAAYYARTAGNHPSVVFYATSHNATGYNEDMNPDMIDGIQDARDSWAERNVTKALRAEEIVRRVDPGRIVYHHASGNLGPMHLSNFYPNFVPVQEMSDWFGHWAADGIKPVFLCEYAAPFTWDWTMYRGWYRGQREFGSAAVPWEFCVAEWNAQFFGDAAFPASETEKTNLRWEAKQFREGRLWHRWDYPHPVDSTRFDERYPVLAAYLTENWRAFRTWGVSGAAPWEYGHFWKLRDGVKRDRRELPVDWNVIQRPGFSPDYIDERYERMDLAYEREDWIATPAAEAFLHNNGQFLAWIAGGPGAFTAKDHLYTPGEVIEKQIVILNDSREAVSVQARWECDLPGVAGGIGRMDLDVAAGQQERVALRFEVPEGAEPRSYTVRSSVRFGTEESQEDTVEFEVLPAPEPVQMTARIAVLDPVGETAAALSRLKIGAAQVGAKDSLEGFDLIVVGKKALSVTGAAPDIRAVRDGLKVVVFEQSSEVLEQRFGFRVAEYGLRQVFPRVPDHPVLNGIGLNQLSNWRGDATLTAPRLEYELDANFNGAPAVRWCGIPVPRLWRCGNRGNVASVLIEKPARGDFLPVIDGGYNMQYSPLLEYREGKGLVLFCQLDVTGRSNADPAADRILHNILRHVADWEPPPRRPAVYVGEDLGRKHFEAAGVTLGGFGAGRLPEDSVLVVGPGSRNALAAKVVELEEWHAAGGHLFAVGLSEDEMSALPGPRLTVRRGEHISTGFSAQPYGSLLAGVGAAELHNRDPRELVLIEEGAELLGNGVLASGPRVVYCQVAPWQFDGGSHMNLKRTQRRLSVLVARLLGNLGVQASTPIVERFAQPANPRANDERWLEGFYLDHPEDWDDPYRFFRW